MNIFFLTLVSVLSINLSGLEAVSTFVTKNLIQESSIAKSDCGEADLRKASQVDKKSLTAAERLAWNEIQSGINTMSNGEEANDLNAAMEYMADDLTLYELIEKDSDRHLKEVKSKVLTRAQVAEYKKKNLASLYSTSPETQTAIQSLSIKGNIASITLFQHYVRVMKGSDGSPHEAITNVRHQEEWIYTEKGWLQKSIREIERGAICLDREPYQP
jgi:hypothetical protein